jgi:hypothetical protein
MFCSRRCACSPASCPGSSSTRWRRSVQAWSAAHAGAARHRLAVDRADRREPQLLQRPAGVPVHRRISARSRSRRSTASPRRDCAARRPGIAAIPTPARRRNTPRRASPSRSAACSAPSCFAPASTSTCPRPATRGRRASTVELHDPSGTGSMRRSRAVGFRRRAAQPSAVPDHPRYLSWCSAPSSCCCWCSRYGPDPRSRRPGVQMLLVLLLAPLLTGFVRKVKARLLRRRARRSCSPIAICAADAQGGGAGGQRLWLFRVAPYLIFAATWVAAALVPTFATGLMFPGRPTSSPSSRCSAARASSWRSPAWMSAPASAASARAAR